MGNNIQFMLPNLFKTANIAVSSGSDTEDNLVDNNKKTYWLSEGSDDSTTETVELDITYEVPFDTIFILGNNIKTGECFYWNGSSYVSIESWSAHKENRRIDLATTQTKLKIKIEATETNIVNTEKRIGAIIVTLSDYELVVNPKDIIPTLNPQRIIFNLNNGKIIKNTISDNTRAIQLEFKNLGCFNSIADAEYIYSLIDSGHIMLLVLCGDSEGSRPPFTYGDIFEGTIIDSSINHKRSGGFDATGDDISITFAEVQP